MAHPEGLFNSHTINRVGPFSPRKIQTAQGLFSSTIGSNPEGSNIHVARGLIKNTTQGGISY